MHFTSLALLCFPSHLTLALIPSFLHSISLTQQHQWQHRYATNVDLLTAATTATNNHYQYLPSHTNAGPPSPTSSRPPSLGRFNEQHRQPTATSVHDIHYDHLLRLQHYRSRSPPLLLLLLLLLLSAPAPASAPAWPMPTPVTILCRYSFCSFLLILDTWNSSPVMLFMS
jgi:hypothetical protein